MSPGALQWNPARQAREFARQLRCMSERSDHIVRCLRLKDWQTLVSAQRSSHNFEQNTFRFWFRPVLDRNSSFSLLRDHPIQLYEKGSFLRVPLMMGVSSHEGSLEFFHHWHQLRPLDSVQRLRFLIRPYLYEFARSEIIATTLNYNYVARFNNTGYAIQGGSHFHHNGQQVNSLETPVLLANRLTPSGQFWHQQSMGIERNEYDVYIGANDFASKQIARQIDAIGDFLYVGPVVKQLELHSQSVAQTYMFLFDYKGSRSFGHIQLNPYGRAQGLNGELQSSGWLPSAPTKIGAIISTETSNFGVTHCDDIFYLLPNDFAPISLSSADASNLQDENAIRSYVTYLVAFASHINEQQGAANNLANWLPFRQTDRNYIRFSDQLPTLYKSYRQSDVAFVNELVQPIEELVNTPLPLFPYEELRDLKISTIGLAILLFVIVLSLLLVLMQLICCRRRSKRRGRMDTFNILNSSGLPTLGPTMMMKTSVKEQQIINDTALNNNDNINNRNHNTGSNSSNISNSIEMATSNNNNQIVNPMAHNKDQTSTNNNHHQHQMDHSIVGLPLNSNMTSQRTAALGRLSRLSQRYAQT